MAEKTKSLEKTARNTFEDSSPSRTPTPSVSPSSFDPAAIQVAAGNMAMQRVAREEGGEDAPGRSESALNFLSAYLQQPPSAPKPPEPKMHGPDPAPKKWGDPGFGAADGGMFGGPGKTTQKPAAPFMGGDANAATAAQEMRVGLAQLENLNNKVLPALRRAAYEGETNMAHLEAKTGVNRIKAALATADKLFPIPNSLVDNSSIAVDRGKLHIELNEVEAKIYYVMCDLEQAWAYKKRLAEEKAKAAKLPKDPRPKPGAHFTKHAALPPAFDFGKVEPGGHATETWGIFNLVNKPVGISVSYQGDSAIQLLEKLSSLNPAGQQSQNGIKLRFDAPKTKGIHRGTITVTYNWLYEVPDAETFHIPVVAHAMNPEERTADEIAADVKAQQTRVEDATKAAKESEKNKKALEDFNKKHPDVETDRFRKAVGDLQIEARRLNQKQIAGITLAENQVAKYKRRLPPKSPNLWFEIAMGALDIASAGIAGRVGKAMELAMAEAKVVEKLAKGMYGPLRESLAYPNRAAISMFPDATKEAIKGGSKRLRAYTPIGGDTAKDGDADKNKDAAYEFFAQQKAALADTLAEREHGILEAASNLWPLVYQNEKAALDVLNIAEQKLRKEAEGIEALNIQAQQSAEAWVRFVQSNSFSENGTPNELHKIGDVRDYHEVKKLDGLIDIGFRLGNRPTDPVQITTARMLGVSDTIAARFTDKPLIDYGVTVRAYGKGGANTNYAEILITVVRSPGGAITLTEQGMGEYLSRKVYRQAGAAELGAKKLIEEEIMSKSLQEHGVKLQHDHDNG